MFRVPHIFTSRDLFLRELKSGQQEKKNINPEGELHGSGERGTGEVRRDPVVTKRGVWDRILVRLPPAHPEPCGRGEWVKSPVPQFPRLADEDTVQGCHGR